MFKGQMRLTNKVSYPRGEKSVDEGSLNGMAAVAVETAVVVVVAASAAMAIKTVAAAGVAMSAVVAAA